MDIQKELNGIMGNPGDLSLIGEIAHRLSYEVVTSETGFEFSHGLIVKVLLENLMQNVLEDDSFPVHLLNDIENCIHNLASSLISLGNGNGFKDKAGAFGALYKKILVNKKRPEISNGGLLSCYMGTKDSLLIVKSLDDKDVMFCDIDLIFEKVTSSRAFMSDFIEMIGNSITNHNVNRLCFVEKRKGPLGTILMLSQIVNEVETPAFIYRTSYLENIGRIKGAQPGVMDNIGIIYDAAISGGGIEEVALHLQEGFGCKVSFAAVVIDYDDGAYDRLSKIGVELMSFSKKHELGRPRVLETTSCGPSSTQITYFRLKDPSQEPSLIKTLFSEKLKFEPYPRKVYATSCEVRTKLERLGFTFEDIEVVDMSSLPQSERNAIRERCRSNALARSKEGIAKLRAKYWG